MGIVEPIRGASGATVEPLAASLARQAVAVRWEDISPAVRDKIKVCLLDLIGCAFESLSLPWSRQAQSLALPLPAGTPGTATIIGLPVFATPADAAFANAVMGHGLVREDMHAGSFSHLGIVVLPSLLGLAQARAVSGRDFLTAAAIGYEVGGKVGRAVMTSELARIHRPTGVTGPIAAAAACARLLGLDAPTTTSAIALGVNAVAGFNQWAHTGGSEMFFEAGAAARSAVTSARLAQSGAFGSPSALDGEAGLFAAMHRPVPERGITLFDGEPEILSVYHKPVPACNFAQTACLAAARVAQQHRVKPEAIRSIDIHVPRAGKLYPGCDSVGPFDHVLQAKMSIQYNVAAALINGRVAEANFALLKDAGLHRLLDVTTLSVDHEMTSAFPGLQGGEVEVTTADGVVHRVRLDNVVNATPAEVRARFQEATAQVLGEARMREVEACVDALDDEADAGALGGLLRTEAGR
jgi:2-methylcitrate dehydratase PrpD